MDELFAEYREVGVIDPLRQGDVLEAVDVNASECAANDSSASTALRRESTSARTSSPCSLSGAGQSSQPASNAKASSRRARRASSVACCSVFETSAVVRRRSL